jgi:serine/threonine protein kinase
VRVLSYTTMTAHPLTGAASQPFSTEIPKRCPACSGRYPADFRVCPRDAQPLEDAPEDEDPLVGTVLSDTYEVLRAIGEGGMGRVYEAAHRRLQSRRFAIKVLHHELARKPDILSRFQREAEAVSALRHPNVVEVFDVNRTPDGRPYLVAELLEGEELGEHLDRVGKLRLTAAIDIVRQLCRALSAAHARGIVHRDIKPENVFLLGGSEPPQIKVLDFGISKVGEGPSTLTRTGMVMGTPAYMPPEQARGARVDHRVDIYAAGAILYRALTGSKPFADDDPMATLSAVIADEPRRPSTIERSIPIGVELVIQRAMAKNPDERYASFAELEAALAEVDPRGADAAGPTAGDVETPIPLASAETLIADGSTRTRFTHGSDSHLVARARPRLVALALAASLWLLAGLVDAMASAVRALSSTEALTRSELTLSMVGALGLLIAPGIYAVRYLAVRVWPLTPRVIETAVRLQRALLASLAGYAVTVLGVRLLSTFSALEPAALASPSSVLAFVVATAGAVAVWVLPPGRKSGSARG